MATKQAWHCHTFIWPLPPPQRLLMEVSLGDFLNIVSLFPGLRHSRHSRFPLPRLTAKKPLRSKQHKRGLCGGEKYDPINDHEKCWNTTRISVDQLFNEQLRSELAVNSQTNHSPSAITICNQPTKISDDQLRKSVRSLKKMKRKAYTVCFHGLEIKWKTSKAWSQKMLNQFICLWLEVVVLGKLILLKQSTTL